MENYTESGETWAALYGTTSVLGFLVNVFMIHRWKKAPNLRDPGHFLLINQAVNNVIVCTVRIPLETHYLILRNSWIFGGFPCTIYQSLQYLYLALSAFNLTFLMVHLASKKCCCLKRNPHEGVEFLTLGTGENYVEPPGMDPQLIRNKKYQLYIICVWLLATLFVAPIWFNGYAKVWTSDYTSRVVCSLKSPEASDYLFASFLANYSLPVIVMLSCASALACQLVTVRTQTSADANARVKCSALILLLTFLASQTILAVWFLNGFFSSIDWKIALFRKKDFVDRRLAVLISYLPTIFQPISLFVMFPELRNKT